MINLGAAGQELILGQSVYLHKHANTRMTVSLKITEDGSDSAVVWKPGREISNNLTF